MTPLPKDAALRSIKRRFKLMNQFRPVTMIARTTPGTHNPRISAQTVMIVCERLVKDPHIQCIFYMRCFFFGLVYVTSCYMLTPRLTECKHFLFDAP